VLSYLVSYHGFVSNSNTDTNWGHPIKLEGIAH
jgi:hypothetical protein